MFSSRGTLLHSGFRFLSRPSSCKCARRLVTRPWALQRCSNPIRKLVWCL